MSSSENDYSYGHNSSDEDGDSNSSGMQDVACQNCTGRPIKYHLCTDCGRAQFAENVDRAIE